MAKEDVRTNAKTKTRSLKRRIIRAIIYILTAWNVEEIFRSAINNWEYTFFFWELNKNWWLWWTIIFGVLIILYASAELDF